MTEAKSTPLQLGCCKADAGLTQGGRGAAAG